MKESRIINLPPEHKAESIDLYTANSGLWAYFLKPVPEWIVKETIAIDTLLLWSSPEDDAWGIKTSGGTKSCKRSNLEITEFVLTKPAKGGGSFQISIHYSEPIPHGKAFFGHPGRKQCPLAISYGSDFKMEKWYSSLNQEIADLLSITARQVEVLDV